MTTDPSDHVSPEETAEAANPSVGTGTPETAPYELPRSPWLARQPLVALLLAIVLADLGALVTELSSKAPDPVLASLLGTLATIAVVGGRFAWLHVTSLAEPKLDPETPLIPAPPST